MKGDIVLSKGAAIRLILALYIVCHVEPDKFTLYAKKLGIKTNDDAWDANPRLFYVTVDSV